MHDNRFVRLTDEFKGLLEVLLEVLLSGVTGGDALLRDARRERRTGQRAGDVKHAGGSELAQSVRVGSILAVTDIQEWQDSGGGVVVDI